MVIAPASRRRTLAVNKNWPGVTSSRIFSAAVINRPCRRPSNSSNLVWAPRRPTGRPSWRPPGSLGASLSSSTAWAWASGRPIRASASSSTSRPYRPHRRSRASDRASTAWGRARPSSLPHSAQGLRGRPCRALRLSLAPVRQPSRPSRRACSPSTISTYRVCPTPSKWPSSSGTSPWVPARCLVRRRPPASRAVSFRIDASKRMCARSARPMTVSPFTPTSTRANRARSLASWRRTSRRSSPKRSARWAASRRSTMPRPPKTLHASAL